MKVVGAQVKVRREAKYPCLATFAKALSIPETAILQIELGTVERIPPVYLYLLAVALDCQPSDLVDMEGAPEVSKAEIAQACSTIPREVEHWVLSPNQGYALAWTIACIWREASK